MGKLKTNGSDDNMENINLKLIIIFHWYVWLKMQKYKHSV